MALFTLNNMAFDRVIDVWGEKDSKIFYYSDQVNSINVETTADAKEYTDNRGAVFYKTYNAKTGTVSITNAMFSTYFASVAAGDEAEGAVATGIAGGVRIGANASSGSTVSVSIPGLESGNVKVVEVNPGGAIVAQFTSTSETISAKDAHTFKVTAANGATAGTVEISASSAKGNSFVISFTRGIAETDVAVVNSATDIPKEHELYIRALAKPLCNGEDDNLKLAIIKVPKFQPSPETTIAISNDQETMDFTGDMLTAYCSADKVLYEIYIIDGDEDYDEFAIEKNGESGE